MNKLWYTTIQFCDDNENEYEVNVIYYVDKCLDTRRDFIDDFQIKDLFIINDDAPIITKKQAYSQFYEQIMNAIVENPGEVAEEF